MKNLYSIFLFALWFAGNAYAMDNGAKMLPTSGGPMNAEWFYDPDNPFKKANDLYQNRQWQDAAAEYELILPIKRTDKYSGHMARINLASCLMAQKKSTPHWKSLDAALDIPKARRLPKNLSDGLSPKSVLVRTDKVGIGDIFHFMAAADILQARTGCYVIFSIRDFLKDTVRSAVKAYKFELVGERLDALPHVDYETHLISLLGHLQLLPHQTAPERVVFAAPERALVVVAEQVNHLLAQNKKLAMVNIGENRQATLIGGKQLPHDPAKHGRHLTSEPFVELLNNHPDLAIIDCGSKEGSLAVAENQQKRCVKIAVEEQAFDTPIALALLMNNNPNIIGVGADTGVTNVFIRALSKAVQRRMALIIPNGARDTGEYDMRMEGEGECYTQMISNCRVYKCKNPQDQTRVIELAYQDMVQEEPVIHSWIQ